MSRRVPEHLLFDILESIGKIELYVKGLSFHGFTESDITFDAVIRNLEIIGEAANRLPEEFKDRHAVINWHKIRGLRNRIVHDYLGIDYEIIWAVIKDFLPELYVQINLMVKDL